MPRPSAKDKIKEFLLANVGVVVNKTQLAAVTFPVAEWARRVRELRDEEQWPILTNNDLNTLKPGEYLLTGPPPDKKDVTFSRNISARLRAEVLDRNGFTCQMCGLSPGEIDPETNRKVRLHVGHIIDKSLGGKDELSNLRTLCSTCNQGAKNVTTERPTGMWLMQAIRRAGLDEQREVYRRLQAKFGDSSAENTPPG